MLHSVYVLSCYLFLCVTKVYLRGVNIYFVPNNAPRELERKYITIELVNIRDKAEIKNKKPVDSPWKHNRL
jgi:hypothetical protein